MNIYLLGCLLGFVLGFVSFIAIPWLYEAFTRYWRRRFRRKCREHEAFMDSLRKDHE